MEEILAYLKSLLAIPSPTGYTREVIQYLKIELEKLGFAYRQTAKGNLIVEIEGANPGAGRLITAHVDTLGAIVRAIKPDGRLKLDKIGGFPWNMIEGENCLIHASGADRPISGTILIHQTSVHVYRDAGTAERTQDNMEVRLDLVTRSAEETRAFGIEVGDFVSFDPRTQMTDTGFVKSRFLDDKVSAAILLGILREVSEKAVIFPVKTYFMFSVFEEVGHGANSSLPEDIEEYLALDMGALGDDQASDEYTVSICVKDGSGPYHFDLRQHLVQLAKDNNIDYRLDIYPYYGSDASAALGAGAEVRHGLMGAGIESSHSYERTHQMSIEATFALTKAYLQSELVNP